ERGALEVARLDALGRPGHGDDRGAARNRAPPIATTRSRGCTVAEPPETLAEQVARGRAAARRRAWDEAYAAFAAANATTGREPADPSADPEHQPADPAAR